MRAPRLMIGAASVAAPGMAWVATAMGGLPWSAFANFGGVGMLAWVLYRLYTDALAQHRADLAAQDARHALEMTTERTARERMHRKILRAIGRQGAQLERVATLLARPQDSPPAAPRAAGPPTGETA